MPTMKKIVTGYKVNGRISIAYDALNESDRTLVDDVVMNPDHFIAQISVPGRATQIMGTPLLYSVSLSAELSAIYRKSGNKIEVIDLMRKATLDQIGRRKTPKITSGRPKPANVRATRIKGTK